MASRDTYLLQIYRGRAVSGRQWAARLTRVPGGESVRFSDPEALLAHLQRVLRGADHSVVADRVIADLPTTSTTDLGTDGGSEGHG